MSRSNVFALSSIILLIATTSACSQTEEDLVPLNTDVAMPAQQEFREGQQSGPIVLRSHTIDTTGPLPEINPMLVASPDADDQLMLLQFSGPIQDKWLKEVSALGDILFVNYIADNAYLILTNESTVDKLQKLFASVSFLQWMGAFHPAYKLSPAFGSVTQNTTQESEVAVTIQFANHDRVGASEQTVITKSLRVLRQAWTVGAYRNVRVVIPQSELIPIASLADVVNIEPWLEPQLKK